MTRTRVLAWFRWIRRRLIVTGFFVKRPLGSSWILSAWWQPRDWSFSLVTCRFNRSTTPKQFGTFLGPLSICLTQVREPKPAPVDPAIAAAVDEARKKVEEQIAQTDWVVELLCVARSKEQAVAIGDAAGKEVWAHYGPVEPWFAAIMVSEKPRLFVGMQIGQFQAALLHHAKAGGIRTKDPSVAERVEDMLRSSGRRN